MTRLRRWRSRVGAAVGAPFRLLHEWWDPIPAEGQVAVVGLLLLGIGLQASLVGLAVPGAILTAIGMGFNLRRRT